MPPNPLSLYAALLCPTGRRVAPILEAAAVTVESRSLLIPAELITPAPVPLALDDHR